MNNDIKNVSLKTSLFYSKTIFRLSEIYNKEPIMYLISNFTEVCDILEHKEFDIIKLLYMNKNNIHKILYDSEEIINLTFDMIKNGLSNYFYLLLLLEENPDIINYNYSIDFIESIYNQLIVEIDNKFKIIIISKLILELINNFRQIDGNDEDNEYSKLIEIENNINNNNINSIKEGNILFDFSKDVITNNKIDKIYIDIINILIKTNKIDDYDYTYNIIKKLDLENIILTETMFDELSDILNEKEYMKNYIIDSKDFIFNNKIINFYYILFKYILKNSIYIYQNKFLLNARKNIIKFSKQLSTNNLLDDKKEMIKYILSFITDSKYYYNICFIEKQNKNKNNSNSNYSQSSFWTNSTIHDSVNSQNIFSSNSQYLSLFNDNEDIFKIINFEKIIEKHEKKKNSSEFIKEMTNGIIISGGLEDKYHIYNSQFELLKDISFLIPSEVSETTKKSNNSSRRIINKISQNIMETNDSINSKNDNFIELLDCSKYAIMKYSIFINYNENIIKISDPSQINISCTGCFEIKTISGNNEYVIYGEKGIWHFDKSLFSLDMNIHKKNPKYNKDKRNYKSGIKINDNFIALTSNSVLPNGEDILVIYDTNNKIIIKEINNSFVNGVNGLYFLEIENEKKKLLLCACKKYLSYQKNGILIIDIEIKEIENEKLSYKFFDTNDFEVNCFCQINKKENKKFIKTNYFFVCGFQNDKRKGMIKLYKIVIEDKNNFNIEFMQDIVIDYTEDFEGFNGTINCIIQSQRNGKFLVSCLDGKICSFSEPNLDFYLKEDNDYHNLII